MVARQPIFVDPPASQPKGSGRTNLIKCVEFTQRESGACHYVEFPGTSLFVEYLKKQQPPPAQAAQCPVSSVLDTLMLVKFQQSSGDDIRAVLQCGIFCGETFRFLGYSNEQLLERSCLMIANKTSEKICDDIAVFSAFYKVLPMETRVEQFGLLFSHFTDVGLTLDEHGWSAISENQKELHDLTWSTLCDKVKVHFGLQQSPSVVHVRYRNYQGLMRRRDLSIYGNKVNLTDNSMEMFKGTSDGRLPDTVGILGYSKPFSVGYLDTLKIMLLVTRGVTSEDIHQLQKEYYGHLSDVNHNKAKWLLPLLGMSSNDYDWKENVTSFQQEEKEKIKQDQLYTNHADQEKQKVRILVLKSREVYGFRDESLKDGQCFFKPTLPAEERTDFENAKRLVVMRHCCYNQDHVRILELVHNGGEGIEDCLVLGGSPDSDKCGGGKLDSGSAKYFVSWDGRLIPEPTRQGLLMQGSTGLGSYASTRLDNLREFVQIPFSTTPNEKEMLTEFKEFFAGFENHLSAAAELFMKYALEEGPSSEHCRQLREPLCGKMDAKTRRERCKSIAEELQTKEGGQEQEDEGGQEVDRLLPEEPVPQEQQGGICLWAFRLLGIFCGGRSHEERKKGEQQDVQEVLCSTREKALTFIREQCNVRAGKYV